MFDWTPKKNNSPVLQKQTDNKNIDFDELFSTDTNTENKPSEIASKTKTIQSNEKEPISAKELPISRKAPKIPVKEAKEEIKTNSTSDEIEIIEPTMINEIFEDTHHEVTEFHIDDEKILPTGAASSNHDGYRSSNETSQKWEYPDVLSFLNDIDSQAVFSTPVKDMKPIENNVHNHEILQPVKTVTETPKDEEEDDDDEVIKKLIKGRFPFHSGKDNFDSELKASSSPYANAFAETANAPPTMIVDDFGDRSLWELQLNNSNLPGMELEEFELINFDHIYIKEMRRGFKRARRDFIKFISYNNQQDLYSAGLDDIDIALLRKGYVSENFNIHRKVPYEYGGNNDFSNFCLIQTHPYHDNLHKFLDMQVFIHPKGAKVKRLFIPIPSGNVYNPYLDINSSGGKSKHDRSVYAGFQEETFNLIAQKTAMGKAAEL